VLLHHPPISDLEYWGFIVLAISVLALVVATVAFMAFGLVMAIRDEWRRFADRNANLS
jgi:hypothetical protein